jgi:hypothetical protein
LVIYGLTPGNIHNYVPDIFYNRLHPLNGWSTRLIDGKFQHRFTLKDFPHLRPETFYLIRERLAFGLVEPLPACRRYEPRLILELLERRQKLFLKPDSGSEGVGAHLLEKQSERWLLDGRGSSPKAVEALLAGLNNYLVCECVEQHPYARKLFPGSVNKIRLISLRTDDKLEPVFIVAFHRVGTRVSQPADNLAAGGLFGRIDLVTGELGNFAAYPKTLKMEWHRHYPETGEQLAGVVVPRWTEVKDTIMKVCRKLVFVPFMGFDVVLTETGMKILEINSLPTVLSQAWEPLMLNQDAADFFKKRIPSLRSRQPRKGVSSLGTAGDSICGERPGLAQSEMILKSPLNSGL